MTHRLAFDTNAYGALRKGDPVLASTAKQAVQLGLPVVVIGELYYGFYNGNRATANIDELAEFMDNPRLEVLHITPDTARTYGEISAELRRIGRPIQQNDVWIAALCKQYGYTLATRDTDFGQIIGLEVINF